MLASFCGACGLQFQPDETFCARCGAPRDTNVSDPTALVVPASNAPTVRSSNLQTICLNCGQPRLAHVFPCPFCNSSVPTIQTQGMPIVQQLATDIPTPPLIVNNPTPQQIQAAMVSTINPYGFGIWGDLVVDGSKQNVWDFSSSNPDYVKTGYVKNEGLVTRLGSQRALHAMPNINCQDFAYQVAIGFYHGRYGGIAFRIDQIQDECYVFYCDSPEDSKVDQVLVEIYDTYYLLDRKETLLKDTTVKFSGRYALFAVVAQGSTLDFYIDLQHIKRVETRFVTSGSIGICSMAETSLDTINVEVRNTKLWLKNR